MLKDPYGPVESDSGDYIFYANGYLMPWSGYHDANRTITDSGSDNNVNGGPSYRQYMDTAAWSADTPPTLRATITPGPSKVWKAGEAWPVSAAFTSPADSHAQVPTGYPSIHHYYAALFDSSGAFKKHIKLDNDGFDAMGINLKNPSPNGSYDESITNQQISVFNGSSARSGTDTFTIPASETAGLADGSYTLILYLFDDIHRYAYQKFPIKMNGQPPASGGGGGATKGDDFKPTATGKIRADERGGEQFNVDDGIPTSESLYVNAFTKNYLYSYEYKQVKDKRVYHVTAKKHYSWQQESGTDANDNPTYSPGSYDDVQDVAITRDFSYWLLNTVEVYSLDKAEVSNYALDNSMVTLNPSGYTPPSFSTLHSTAESAHVFDPDYERTYEAPSEDLGQVSSAPSISRGNYYGDIEPTFPDVEVKNDKFLFEGDLLMDDTQTPKDGPPPQGIPTAEQTDENVLFQANNVIQATKQNRLREPSSGTVYYKPMPGGVGSASAKSYPFDSVNPVTIHTPVVAYASVTDDKAHNQKTVPATDRSALILERKFTVTLPTVGWHREILNYDYRDYEKYTRLRQVQFPFDVLTADQKGFIKKDTWINFPDGADSMTFFLPVWVDEGFYNTYFRAMAINCPTDGFQTQPNANTDLTKYTATDVVPVDVVGRVYNFHVTDIADYNWQYVFRNNDGVSPTYASYWVGDRDIDGDARGNSSPYLLPIHPGSHPNLGMKNISVKTGYHFKFDLMTKGNMFGPKDGVRITPTFYFVNNDGSDRKPVDLYYRTNDKPFVKIGSTDDVEKRYVILNEPLRDVPSAEITNTASYLYDTGYRYSSTTDQNSFISSYFRNAEKKTWVGGYDLLLHTAPLRTFLGPLTVPAGADKPGQAPASIQHWYGEYSLPAAPYVVPQGFNLADYGRTNRLDDHSQIWLKNGYIIVNFKIETIQNEDINHPHLQYQRPAGTPYDNQWRMEGFRSTAFDAYGHKFDLQDGDVVFYHADKSSRDDFNSSGSH